MFLMPRLQQNYPLKYTLNHLKLRQRYFLLEKDAHSVTQGINNIISKLFNRISLYKYYK